MIYFGIDPDVKKSGFAIWDNESKELDYGCLPFWDLIKKIDYYARSFEVQFVIEAGWLNAKSNFHSRPYQSKHVGERIAKNVGSNHQVGKLLVEFCEKNKLNFTTKKPTAKKVTYNYIKSITGKEIKNQDIIDAVMLVYGIN
jgi:hypothetical protein